MSSRAFAVNRTARSYARGFLRPNSRLEESIRHQTVLSTEPISKCQIRAFRRYIGTLLIRAGFGKKSDHVSKVVPAIQNAASSGSNGRPDELPDHHVRIERLQILEPLPGRDPNKFVITLSFLKPPPGWPRSGQYSGTVADFRYHCIRNLRVKMKQESVTR